RPTPTDSFSGRADPSADHQGNPQDLGHRNIQNTRIYAQISHPLRTVPASVRTYVSLASTDYGVPRATSATPIGCRGWLHGNADSAPTSSTRLARLRWARPLFPSAAPGRSKGAFVRMPRP